MQTNTGFVECAIREGIFSRPKLPHGDTKYEPVGTGVGSSKLRQHHAQLLRNLMEIAAGFHGYSAVDLRV